MRTFNQYITELFDKPAKWRLDIEDREERMSYEADIDGNKLTVDFLNQSDSNWEVYFDVNGKSNVTGEGNELTVFSTVIDIMSDFAEKVDAEFITFDAAKDENAGDSRVKLYNRLIKKFASSHGYSLVDTREMGSYTSYVMSKNK